MTRAQEIAKELRESGEWILEACEELCMLADMAEEWEMADGENFESVIFAAAEKLGVDVL